MKLLLLSNSTNAGYYYLSHANEWIKNFLGNKPLNLTFIPYAAVTLSYDEYALKVSSVFNELGHKITSVHTVKNPIELIQNCDGIIVGGGNTFQLLKLIYDNNLVNSIKTKLLSSVPYIGWSAGSNLACPTIMTTNDMPIAQPPTFDGLNLVPFQINPHYTEATLMGHGGESRDDRINEFVELNRSIKVIGLPEGTAIEVLNNKYKLLGNKPAKIFKYAIEPNYSKDI